MSNPLASGIASAMEDLYRATLKREDKFGKRPVRVTNCSISRGDPAVETYKQAKLGDIDFITGNYLAEVNIAQAEAYAADQHPGYKNTAWEGLQQAMDVIQQKRIKIAINEKKYNLRVAYVSGDDLSDEVGQFIPTKKSDALPYLDSSNPAAKIAEESFAFVTEDGEPHEVVSANAYLGARGVDEGFRQGADTVITGRISDASPVIAAAGYGCSWSDRDYDRLARALVAGHLIECSAYVTCGNFAGFTAYDLDNVLDPGFPIAEIAKDGTCVITKHPGTGGMVKVDTVRCQLLYELEGNVYLNSYSKAVLDNIVIEQAGKGRVHVHGVKGLPAPPTTKLAIFYKGGFEAEILINAAGYGWAQKAEVFECQVRRIMGEEALRKLDFVQFQRIGMRASNPTSQTSSTIYIRIFAQAREAPTLFSISKAVGQTSLKHFHGFHCSTDMRSAIPRPYFAYYPTRSFPAGKPPLHEPLPPRETYNARGPLTTLSTTPCRPIRLGIIALARSGEKALLPEPALLDLAAALPDFLRDRVVEVAVGVLEEEKRVGRMKKTGGSRGLGLGNAALLVWRCIESGSERCGSEDAE
ncbi:DUF1446-domain-containing protein [Saccharata proteae CBS 121410]|uniref:DUF1446-domain-containing protein n=1 Tax=Saccharata proteae CBS 121410 TaxID=1314787 RepID=A0A9P4LZE2_9PEZI|nr:DUF1446-domain-containing protein [Saccharata proteae CBS 121410]